MPFLPATPGCAFAADLARQRSITLEAAFHANPTRFKHVTPQPPEVPLAAWINPPAKKKPNRQKLKQLLTK